MRTTVDLAATSVPIAVPTWAIRNSGRARRNHAGAASRTIGRSMPRSSRDHAGRSAPSSRARLAAGDFRVLVDAGGENSAAAGAYWLSGGKGVVWVVADPAGRISASEPRAHRGATARRSGAWGHDRDPRG